MPICPSVLYFGHFDGQGHRIKGMVLTTASKLVNRNNDGQGFFGSVSGGGTDANGTVTNEVIIDASCSIQHDQNFVAGVVGRINSRNDENSNIIICNCGNEANVSTTGKNAAGILGCVDATNVGLKLYNLWNKGNITGNAGESAAICAWTGQRNVNGEVDVEGCWNIGEVTGVDGNDYNLIRRNSNIVPRNIVDLCTTNAGNQGKVAVLNTPNPIESGELCYLLNGDQTTIVYTQNLGTDEMPVYGTTSSQVYQAGTVNCIGAAVGGVTYNNTSGETITLPHNINAEIGMCDICHTQFQEPDLVSDWYELRNAGNVEWYSQYVATAGGTHKSAKLMNDIDFLGIENLHSPIGPNEQNKFNATFDGQGFRIKNLIINRPEADNQGFFGWLRGNNADTRIENLIIDKSCSFTAKGDVGALSGNSQNSGYTIYLHNIVNEANVTGSGQNVAGLVASNGNNSKWDIRNCVNAGNIKSTHATPYAGAVGGYLGNNGQSVIENFINTGKIEGYNGTNRLGRWYGQTPTNIIDAGTEVNSSNNYYCPESATSGALTYYANKQAGSDVFYQLIGTDTHPVLDISHKQVILNGTYQNTASTLALSDMNSFGTNSNFDVTSVTMERTLKAGKWNTFCVPFDMTAAEITDQLGSGTEVKELTGATQNGENYTMTFTDADAIVAGTCQRHHRLGGVHKSP